MPMMPGIPERRTHSYVHHGTLFVALDIASGSVIGKCYKRHRAAEFFSIFSSELTFKSRTTSTFKLSWTITPRTKRL